MNSTQIVLLIFGIIAFIILLVLLIAYACYRKAFFARRKSVVDEDGFKLPKGAIYDKYRDMMIEWIKEVRAMPYEDMQITSFDGLILKGKYYEYAPDAPIELMFHGYRGCAESDLCGGVRRCFALGCNALIVDHRGAGRSQGNTITFGINESRDCLSWLEFMGERFGADTKIILTGISMGAATVLMAAGKQLPKNVIGVLADCGYTSPKEIIKKVISEMNLPADIAYPFVKLGAKLYGHFDLDSDSPIEAMSRSRVPIIFFHGESDGYVPCEMSKRNYDACVSKKRLVTVPDAGHGLAYMVDPERYVNELRVFYDSLLNANAEQ